VAAIDDDAFRRDLHNSFASIQRTLVHIIAAEWIWLRRWKGQSPTDMPDGWEDMDLATIQETWTDIDDERSRWLASLGNADLDRTIEYLDTRGEAHARHVWQMLRHVINHSSYHRGQVTTMLRQLGATAATTDLIYYFAGQ
jgi:uncharacterized damage-inducible protein DinB